MADFDRSVNKMAYEMKIVIVEYRKLDDRIAGATCTPHLTTAFGS